VSGGRIKVALGVGLLLGAGAVAFTLSQAPTTIARVSTPQQTFIAEAQRKARVCQSGEVLPRETSAIRLRMFAFLGPRVALEVLAHGRVLTHGERGSGWTGGVVTVPVSPLPTAQQGVQLCFTLFGNGDESVGLAGEPTSAALAARGEGGALSGRVRVEYMRPGRASWWSLAPEVARRMGLGHAAAGTWSVLLVIALMASLLATCSRLLLRELR
jgi:hypothetical protein